MQLLRIGLYVGALCATLASCGGAADGKSKTKKPTANNVITDTGDGDSTGGTEDLDAPDPGGQGLVTGAGDYTLWDTYEGPIDIFWYDADGAMVDSDSYQHTVGARVDAFERVWISNFVSDECDLEVDIESGLVVDQECSQSSNEGWSTIGLSGTIQVDHQRLVLRVEATIVSFDAATEEREEVIAEIGYEAAAASNASSLIPSDVAKPDDPVHDGECTTNADCEVDQECTSHGACRYHQYCAESSSWIEDALAASWGDCDDNKEYEGICEIDADRWLCDCRVNGVRTDVFEADFDDPNTYAQNRLHRLFNAGCGWLQPELYQ